MRMIAIFLSCVFICFSLTACASKTHKNWRNEYLNSKETPQDIRNAIASHSLMKGMTFKHVVASIGFPSYKSKRKDEQKLFYGGLSLTKEAGEYSYGYTEVYLKHGKVTGWKKY